MSTNRKIRAALVSNVSNATLVIGKLTVGFFSGSVSIISEAAHSLIDLFASMIAYIAVKKADEPPDLEHQYGHGKFEDISGLFEGLLIFFAAGWIIYEAVHKLIKPDPVEHIQLGMIIMFVSGFLNFYVSKYLHKVAIETDSIALEADALHLRVDVYTSFAVFAALLLMNWINILMIDPIAAILVAILILKTSFELSYRSFKNLTDYSLSESDLETVKKIICQHNDEFIEFHDLRARKSGAEKHIDLHLTMRKDIPLEKAHGFCDHLESDIIKEIPKARVLIHLEPGL